MTQKITGEKKNNACVHLFKKKSDFRKTLKIRNKKRHGEIERRME